MPYLPENLYADLRRLSMFRSLFVIACKLLRVIYMILRTETRYYPEKLLKDIKRPVARMKQAVA